MHLNLCPALSLHIARVASLAHRTVGSRAPELVGRQGGMEALNVRRCPFMAHWGAQVQPVHIKRSSKTSPDLRLDLKIFQRRKSPWIAR